MVAGSSSTVFINEVNYDNNGNVDPFEGVEIANTSNTDLTGWTLVLYNQTGATYATYNLSGSEPFTYVLTPGFENGPKDGLALVNALGQVVQLLSYEGTFTATNGPAAGLASTEIPGEAGAASANKSIQLIGTGSTAGDFTWGTAPVALTRGDLNAGQTINFAEVKTTGTEFADNLLGSNHARDVIIAMGGHDIVNGRGGDDFVLGNKGNDTLRGGDGADMLYGGVANDILYGDAGADILFGDKQNDTLTGGTGADKFVFKLESGSDVILDFEDGIDRIEYSRKVFADFAAVQARMVQDGTDVVITDLKGNVLRIDDITVGQLTAADFLFV